MCESGQAAVTATNSELNHKENINFCHFTQRGMLEAAPGQRHKTERKKGKKTTLTMLEDHWPAAHTGLSGVIPTAGSPEHIYNQQSSAFSSALPALTHLLLDTRAPIFNKAMK